MEEIKTIVCSRCKEEKPVSEFYKSSTSASGYMHQCKMCRAQIVKESRERRNCLTPPNLQEGSPEFAGMQSRVLISQLKTIITELKARGYQYRGELTFLRKIKL